MRCIENICNDNGDRKRTITESFFSATIWSTKKNKFPFKNNIKMLFGNIDSVPGYHFTVPWRSLQSGYLVNQRLKSVVFCSVMSRLVPAKPAPDRGICGGLSTERIQKAPLVGLVHFPLRGPCPRRRRWPDCWRTWTEQGGTTPFVQGPDGG